MLINNNIFFCDSDLIHADQFTVLSIPKNYNVVYKNHISRIDANILVIDATVFRLHANLFNIDSNNIFLINATENNKSLDTITHLIDFFQKNKITKSNLITVVGGGITQEIAAFACAIYKRGIPWIYYPTTLLSMSDSCLGGKASVNYCGVKNQLGLFSTPIAIHITPLFLETLSDSDISSGLGEILKSCIIGGPDFLNVYQTYIINGKIKSKANFHPLIFASLSVKKTIIESDEFESDIRRVLNYGHTFGHAIEAISNFDISHGEAIVAGMILANKLSVERNLMNERDAAALNQLCVDLLSVKTISFLKDISVDNMARFIQQDKKATHQNVTFVLAKACGAFCFESLDPTALQIRW